MSDQIDLMVKSIYSKAQGRVLARLYMGHDCGTCGQILEPYDIGVDPDTNDRAWVSDCCGNMLYYTQQDA